MLEKHGRDIPLMIDFAFSFSSWFFSDEYMNEWMMKKEGGGYSPLLWNSLPHVELGSDVRVEIFFGYWWFGEWFTIDEGNAKVSPQHQHDKCGREEVDNTIQSGNMKTATTQREKGWRSVYFPVKSYERYTPKLFISIQEVKTCRRRLWIGHTEEESLDIEKQSYIHMNGVKLWLCVCVSAFFVQSKMGGNLLMIMGKPLWLSSTTMHRRMLKRQHGTMWSLQGWMMDHHPHHHRRQMQWHLHHHAMELARCHLQSRDEGANIRLCGSALFFSRRSWRIQFTNWTLLLFKYFFRPDNKWKQNHHHRSKKLRSGGKHWVHLFHLPLFCIHSNRFDVLLSAPKHNRHRRRRRFKCKLLDKPNVPHGTNP